MDNEIFNFTLPVTIFEIDEQHSGLVDEKGRPLVRRKEPLGFKLVKKNDT